MIQGDEECREKITEVLHDIPGKGHRKNKNQQMDRSQDFSNWNLNEP